MSTNEKYIVTIDDGFDVISVQANKDELLLDVLRKSGKSIVAPCGGKGTCKKCTVDVAGAPELACQYRVQGPVSVAMPALKTMRILSKAHIAEKHFDDDSGIEIIAGEKRVVAYKGDPIIVDSESGEQKYGVAIDVGTTTAALFLVDLDSGQLVDSVSFINPQAAYGGDVISRVSYCIENRDGVQILQRILIDAVNSAIEGLCIGNDISPDDIYKTTIVGNTVMQHILCGVNPRSIAFAPYTPVFIEEKLLRGRDLRLLMHEQGVVKILPSVAGYVGADIVAGAAAVGLLQNSGVSLYIDIGTNGEMVLSHEGRLLCCATAAGPAFEGARIACGVGGVTGAISEYEDGDYAVIGGGAPIGICGSAVIDIVAALLDAGRIDMMGYMESDFLLAAAENSATGRPIVLTPNDVREVQLAKAAIYAGIETLLKVARINFNQIDRLYLAGGFGNYIRVQSALRIGLLPRELEGKIIAIGNSAGAGARLALKSAAFEKTIQRVLDHSQYIELSMRQDFNEAYVAAMVFS